MKRFAWGAPLALALSILYVGPAPAEQKTPAQYRNELFGTPLPPDEAANPSRLMDLTDAESGKTTLYLEFANGSAELSTDAKSDMANLLIALKSPEAVGRRLEISGHTSRTGSATFNRALSLRRAEAVRRYFESKKLPTDHFTVAGYGFDRLLNQTDPAAAENRRVEIKVLN